MAGSASRRMLPPSPPSPPSGPPRGTNFSRRKLMQPAPPSPPRTRMSISSMNIRDWSGAKTRGLGTALRPSGRLGEDADEARVAPALEPDVAVDLREQGVVVAATHVEAGLEASPALAHEDAAAGDELAAEALDAEHLRVRVTTVPGAADALLVRH